MPRSDRGKHARRLVQLILLAQRHRYVPDVETLAREHGVHPRTIRRDLEAIESAMPVRWRHWEWAS